MAAEHEAPLRPGALDQIVALERESGQRGLVGRLVDAYLRSSMDLLEQIRAAHAAEDAQALGEAAHTLKSSSAQLGAETVSALAKELEMRGRQRSLEGTRELILDLAADLEEVHEALAAERAGLA